MRASPLLLLLVLAGCPNIPAEVCGLSTTLPDNLADGRGSATRSDGEDFSNEAASWTPDGDDSLTIGVLDFFIAKETTGLDTEQLIADGAFPICVPLAERSNTSGAANLVSDGLVTDASHTGGVAILDEDNGFLIGRFEAELANGNAEVAFTDGVFKASRR
jgi:hypothetical protein